MSDVESLVVGKYDNIEVKADSCIHTGKEFPIQWINEYAFYFQYAPGNDQIWVYDTIRNCLYQMYNSVPAGILNRASSKFGDKKEVYFNVDQDCLGFFDGNMIYPNAWGNICGDVRPIIWLNPMAFYLKWADGNEQIWVYEANKNTVLQLHTVGTNTVYEAMHHTKWTFRRS